MIKCISREEIEKKLLIDIGEKRLQHSIRVAETAVILAQIYDVDEKKAYLSGLLHDCGKFKDKDDLLKYGNFFDIISEDIFIYNTQLIHAPLGARMAKDIYGIEDEEIINSIKYHTTGRENMSILEKIIFLADYIEPMRNFKGVEILRSLAKKDLNKAVINVIEQSIKLLIDRDKLIHIDSVRALNFLKLEIMKRGE